MAAATTAVGSTWAVAPPPLYPLCPTNPGGGFAPVAFPEIATPPAEPSSPPIHRLSVAFLPALAGEPVVATATEPSPAVALEGLRVIWLMAATNSPPTPALSFLPGVVGA